MGAGYCYFQNTVPERFELASFYRIVRDEKYIPFLKEVGVSKIQLSFFGLKETQDRYVGRKGAFEEVMQATELLIREGITPRWQCFINEKNKDDILKIYKIAKEIRQNRCPDLEFFAHEGSCDGENRKLYPIRIRKDSIPDELKEVYFGFESLLTEKECIEKLKNDSSHPVFIIGNEITLNISTCYDVFYNFTHMTEPWKIGNLKTDNNEELIQRVITGNTNALNKAKLCKWTELAAKYGDPSSERVFN